MHSTKAIVMIDTMINTKMNPSSGVDGDSVIDTDTISVVDDVISSKNIGMFSVEGCVVGTDEGNEDVNVNDGDSDIGLSQIISSSESSESSESSDDSDDLYTKTNVSEDDVS